MTKNRMTVPVAFAEVAPASTAIPVAESQNNTVIIPKALSSTSQPCSSENWTETQKLLASNGAAYDWFGCSVSIDGIYALIGADGGDNNQYFTGAAYVYKRDGTNWTQNVKLLALDGTVDDNFGCSVSLDGDYALIGTVADDDQGSDSGSAYVFKRDGTNWTQEAKLLASDGEGDDNFGRCVSLDGKYAIISSPMDDDNGADAGAVYVFKRDGINCGPKKQSFSPQTAKEEAFLAFLFLSLLTPPSSVQLGMITTEPWILVVRTCSPAAAPPGHNSKNSLPQTEQQRMFLAFLFLLLVTLLSLEHLVMTTESILVLCTCSAASAQQSYTITPRVGFGYGIEADVTCNIAPPANGANWVITMTGGWIFSGNPFSGTLAFQNTGETLSIKGRIWGFANPFGLGFIPSATFTVKVESDSVIAPQTHLFMVFTW